MEERIKSSIDNLMHSPNYCSHNRLKCHGLNCLWEENYSAKVCKSDGIHNLQKSDRQARFVVTWKKVNLFVFGHQCGGR